MDEGLGISEFEEYAPKPLSWTPYFSHAMNECGFQTTLVDWFSGWQHPLNPEDPTDLDWAIAQTNLFIDAPDRFGDMGRGHDEWIQAIEDLMMVAEFINASGIMFVSTLLGDNIARYINSDQDRDLEWRNETGIRVEWSRKEYGQLELRTAKLSSIPLVNVCYPNLSVPRKCVRESAEVMAPWLDAVLNRYSDVQARMPHGGLRPARPWIVSQVELAGMVRRSRDSGL